ncbi:MAG: glycosyltransferase [Candidatus Anammoxibacter sp.]
MFEYELNPRNIKRADIVFGLCSYNEADNISNATRKLDEGLKKFYSDKKCVIINCDNSSPDDTKSVFMNTETSCPKIYITTHPGVAGKGYNLENMFRKAHQLGAGVVVCIDADIKSIEPEWVQHFTAPILKGYDFVTPIYSRHKYDGTITNNICFPLIYGLFCTDIRQPIGGDFALSGKFADYNILQPWHRTTGQYGIDIFLTLNAILGGFKVSQTGLGTKVHKPSAPKLGPMFLQVIGTAFLFILNDLHKWKDLQAVVSTEKFGKSKLDKEQELDVDRDDLREKVNRGYNKYLPYMEKYLKKDTFQTVKGNYESGDVNVTDDLWVKIIYEIMAAFYVEDNTDLVLETFRALYFARTLTFINDTWDMSTAGAEELVIRQAKKFFDQRSYLIDLISNHKIQQLS